MTDYMTYHDWCSVRNSVNLPDFMHARNFPCPVDCNAILIFVLLCFPPSVHQHRQFSAHINQVMRLAHALFAQILIAQNKSN